MSPSTFSININENKSNEIIKLKMLAKVKWSSSFEFIFLEIKFCVNTKTARNIYIPLDAWYEIHIRNKHRIEEI